MGHQMLVAGIGNIFLSDDAFGVEVVRRLAGRPRPDGVEVMDVGIRGVHLAYQLLDGYDCLVLVDAAPRGRVPGTVSLLEVDPAELGDVPAGVADGEAALMDAHSLDPASLLRMLAGLGGRLGRVYVVACEPESVAEGIGLSPCVEAALTPAVDLVESLMRTGVPSSAGASATTSREEVSP